MPVVIVALIVTVSMVTLLLNLLLQQIQILRGERPQILKKNLA